MIDFITDQRITVAYVMSESHEGVYYKVLIQGDKRSCSCPDHRNRQKDCKHIREVLENTK